MSHVRHRFLGLLAAIAFCATGGIVVAGPHGHKWKAPHEKGHKSTRSTPAEAETRADPTRTKWFSGEIDPTNIPVLSGDFQALMASIAPGDMIRVQANDAQRISTGRGVTVAVLDGGFVLTHPAIADHLSPLMWDAVSHDSDPSDLGNGIDDDDDGFTDLGVGHGTMVASLVVRGAPNVTIMPIRVADDEGYGTQSSLAEGLRFAVEHGANVINMSFHLDAETWPKASHWLDLAEQMGIVVICAAGNEGLDTLEAVAAGPTTLTVGAVDCADGRAAFSNYGSNVNIYAPGVDTLGAYGAVQTTTLCIWSGTSFAAPFVSAAAALVRERHPDWPASAVRNALVSSVDPARPAAGELLIGGRINLLKAARR